MSDILASLESHNAQDASLRKKAMSSKQFLAQSLRSEGGDGRLPVNNLDPDDIPVKSRSETRKLDDDDDDYEGTTSKHGKMREFLSKMTAKEVFEEVRAWFPVCCFSAFPP